MTQTMPNIDYSQTQDAGFGTERLGRLADARQKAQDGLTMRSPAAFAGVALRRLSAETLDDQNTVNVSSTGALLLDEDDDAGVKYDPIGHVRIRFMDNYPMQDAAMSLDLEIDVVMTMRVASIVLTDGLMAHVKTLGTGDFIYLAAGVGFKPMRIIGLTPQMTFGNNAPLYVLEPSGEILYDESLLELGEEGDLASEDVLTDGDNSILSDGQNGDFLADN